jgi:SH3-like domain-containing protein
MRYRVLLDYAVQYPAPIRLSAGQVVRVGRADEEYPDWRWCAGPDGTEGWVPCALLALRGDDAVVERDYDATELAVHAGEEVQLEEEISGWSRVTSARGDSGWVPSRCLRIV